MPNKFSQSKCLISNINQILQKKISAIQTLVLKILPLSDYFTVNNKSKDVSSPGIERRYISHKWAMISIKGKR